MRRLTFLGMLIILMLAGCGGFNEEDFASALKTAFEEGEWGDFNEQVCERDEVGFDTVPGNEDLNIECSLDGSTVDCEITSNDSEDTARITAVLDDDDKACDVTLIAPTGEMVSLNEGVIDINDPILDELEE